MSQSAKQPDPSDDSDPAQANAPTSRPPLHGPKARRPSRNARHDRTAIDVQRSPHPKPLPPSDQLRFGEVFTDHMFLLDHADGAWTDARIVPFASLPLSPAAAVLHYAQAMFEGLKAYRGIDGRVRIFRLDRHVARMGRGAARLCMPAPSAEVMREALLAFTRAEDRWVPEGPGTALYLRPTLIASEPFLGVRPAKQYLFFIIASPTGGYFGTSDGPLRLKVEERYVRAAAGGLGAVKAAANYAASLRAAEEAHAEGFAQVLWTDAEEHRSIEEAGTMNVFVRVGDEIVTPPLGGTILAGITRDAVITLLRRWGHNVRERKITMDEILEARRTGRLREMFGTGTGASIAAIGELAWQRERIVVGDGGEGPLARRLLPTFREIQTGVAPDPDGWMTEI